LHGARPDVTFTHDLRSVASQAVRAEGFCPRRLEKTLGDFTDWDRSVRQDLVLFLDCPVSALGASRPKVVLLTVVCGPHSRGHDSTGAVAAPW
jgi:hypothetical protein